MGRVRATKNYIIILRGPSTEAVYLNGEKVIEALCVTLREFYHIVGQRKIERIVSHDVPRMPFPQKLKDVQSFPISLAGIADD